uniref:Immunoglobulin V-set domain-containing protein n=1 Tax=Acanthochromis polyacanthus TaxID=80966 RepID=A0A3Q1FWL5_9TELE
MVITLELFTINSNLGLRTVIEGEDITVACSFSVSGHTKFFCRETCEGNILIKTTEDTAENGRYSIRYEHKPITSDDILYVSIKQLKKSDSGWYRCVFYFSLIFRVTAPLALSLVPLVVFPENHLPLPCVILLYYFSVI